MHRKITAIAALAGLFATPVFAAEMPLKAPPPPPPPAVSWTGCYVDGGVGYGLWNADHYTETNPGLVHVSEGQTDGGRGWLGRLGGGCDVQLSSMGLSNWVVGAFGDYDFMGLKGTINDPDMGPGGLFGPATSASVTENGAWYVGGRIGYLPYPNLMAFLSGGWTQTRFSSGAFSFLFPASPLTGIGFNSETYSGWFLGGGYEYALPWLHGLFWKTEYRFAEYQAVDVPFIFTATGAPNGFGQHDQPYVQTITSGLVWRFNFGGPIATRY